MSLVRVVRLSVANFVHQPMYEFDLSGLDLKFHLFDLYACVHVEGTSL
jgi:hypothetical protein